MPQPRAIEPQRTRRRGAVLRRVGLVAIGAGFVLLAIYAGIRLDSALGRRKALEDFRRARESAPARPAAIPPALPPSESAPAPPPAIPPAVPPALSGFESPDKSLWSRERVEGFQASLGHSFAPPLAVLRVPKIDLEVPVLEGTDDLALNRGVGHIENTPLPGEPGNVGIAGHRDGFFRGLKDVAEGDTIEVETLAGLQRYTVQNISIVSPDQVDVLAPTEQPSLTLVTCYPFYYVGSAPRRYIVRATMDGAGR